MRVPCMGSYCSVAAGRGKKIVCPACGTKYAPRHRSSGSGFAEAFVPPHMVDSGWGGWRPGAGAPRSRKPRCPCGAMTAKRAKARCHYCSAA